MRPAANTGNLQGPMAQGPEAHYLANIVRATNQTFAGRSARRRMYHGNQ